MMPTSRLHRWVLRGVLFTAAVVPFAAAESAGVLFAAEDSALAAEWNWTSFPASPVFGSAANVPGAPEDDDQVSLASRDEEWNWG
jgi:hypothetical protein